MTAAGVAYPEHVIDCGSLSKDIILMSLLNKIKEREESLQNDSAYFGNFMRVLREQR